MNRINLFRNAVRSNPVTLDSVTWGKRNFDKTTSTLVFAGLLILAVLGVALYVIFSFIEVRVTGWAHRKDEFAMG